MTDRYAVFGNPLSHSKSPLIHMTFARDTGEDIDYGKIEPALDGFAASVATFRAAGGRGINITTPFKLEAHALATRRMPRADSAGAANCLKFEGDEIVAENFDRMLTDHRVSRARIEDFLIRVGPIHRRQQMHVIRHRDLV